MICEGSPGKQMHLDQEIGGGGTKGKVFCSRRGAAPRGFRVDEGLSQAAAGGGPSAVLIQAFAGGETTWEDTKDRRGKDDDRQTEGNDGSPKSKGLVSRVCKELNK